MAIEPLKRPGKLLRAVQEFRYAKHEASEIGKHRDKLKDRLKAYVERHGERDADGHIWLELGDVVHVNDGEPINALKNERRVYFAPDEDEAAKLLRRKNLDEERLFDFVPVLNEEKLNDLLKKRIITKAEYDRVMVQKENYAFTLKLVE